jgi:hypothetical protein
MGLSHPRLTLGSVTSSIRYSLSSLPCNEGTNLLYHGTDVGALVPTTTLEKQSG